VIDITDFSAAVLGGVDTPGGAGGGHRVLTPTSRTDLHQVIDIMTPDPQAVASTRLSGL
jgi:hypothetical protein